MHGEPAESPRPGIGRRAFDKLLLFVPPIGLALALLALTQFVEWGKTLDAIITADPAWLAASVCLALVATVIVTIKLQRLMDAIEISRSWKRCWSAVMASLTLNTFLPSRGGDLYKVVSLHDTPESRQPLLSAVIVERAIDILVLSVISLSVALSAGRPTEALIALLLCSGAFAGIMTLAFADRLSWLPARLVGLSQAARVLRKRLPIAATICGLSLLWSINNILIFACLLRAVGEDSVTIERVFVSMPLAVLAGVVPISISGIGTRDGALALLLADQASASGIVAAAFLYTAVAYWFLGIVGVFVLGVEALRTIKKRAQPRIVP